MRPRASCRALAYGVRREWLPTAADREYVSSIMTQVTEPGKFAPWIAPPRVGINEQAIGFPYVRT